MVATAPGTSRIASLMFLRCSLNRFWSARSILSIQSNHTPVMLHAPAHALQGTARSQAAPAVASVHSASVVPRGATHPVQLQDRVSPWLKHRQNSSWVPASSSVTTHVAADADVPPQHLERIQSNFCRVCGSKMQLIKAPAEKEWRHICTNQQCGYIDYHNPRLVVGCIVEHEGKILLCRRGIEPCKGLWTVPAGYMELSESTAQGAARETREEACAEVDIHAPFCHWDIPVIGQAYILFRGKLASPFTHAPGPESLETRLFAPEEIPFDSIAFSSVALSLRYYLEDRHSGWRIHHGVVDKRPGSGPNDPSSFGVVKLMQLPLR